MSDPFSDLHGLRGLYVFVNHPARVKVLCHEDAFERLMTEADKEMQSRRRKATPKPKGDGRFGGWHLCGRCQVPVTNGEKCPECGGTP